MRREMFFGLIWGLALGLLTVALLFSSAKSAVLPDDSNGVIRIAISGDSVTIEIDNDGVVRSVTVQGDSLNRTPTGLKVDNELLIEDGKIYIDSVELTEQQLSRLFIDQNEKSDWNWSTSDRKGHRQVRRKRLATIYRENGNDLVKFRDIVVDSSATVGGDVVSISGDITVYGDIDGDVVSVFGNIYLKNGARVHGDVAAPMGKIVRELNVILKGDMTGQKEVKKNEVSFSLSARFNRVEGFTLLPGLKYEDNKDQLPKVSIDAAYALTLKRWEYDFGVWHRFGKKIKPYFDLHMFQVADTPDRWRLTEVENTVAGLFFKEDFWDLYWSRGFGGEGGLYLTDNFQAGALYTVTRISNLSRTASKAIFGGHKTFRENWSTILPDSTDILASAGDLKEVGLKLKYDSNPVVNKKHNNISGLTALLEWRKTVDASDFHYQVTTIEAQSLLPIATNQIVVLNARGGYSNDNLPLFRRFFIGGIGSLRGYDFKEFQGNRYGLLSADYVWRFFHTDFGAGIFFDAGKAASSARAFRTGGAKTDVGISFLIEDAFRLDLAQRLDDLNRHPVVSARLEMPF